VLFTDVHTVIVLLVEMRLATTAERAVRREDTALTIQATEGAREQVREDEEAGMTLRLALLLLGVEGLPMLRVREHAIAVAELRRVSRERIVTRPHPMAVEERVIVGSGPEDERRCGELAPHRLASAHARAIVRAMMRFALF
jgi:hypothetical protein